VVGFSCREKLVLSKQLLQCLFSYSRRI